MTFGEKLRAIRETKGLTREQLEDRSGIPFTTIRDWELGRRDNPSWDYVQKIAAALGVSCEALRDDQPTDPIPQEDTRPKGKRK